MKDGFEHGSCDARARAELTIAKRTFVSLEDFGQLEHLQRHHILSLVNVRRVSDTRTSFYD